MSRREDLLTYGHKKRSTAVLQPLLTLKSNTMKNTMQRYGLLGNLTLKSNTMKNTMQRYGLLGNLQIIGRKSYVL